MDPLTGCFEIIQYEYSIEMSIADLVESTWLSR